MRNYQLYLIVNEFASHYFGRERMFFQLFQEHEEAVVELKVFLRNKYILLQDQFKGLKIHQVIVQN